jgi:hypothetical protein
MPLPPTPSLGMGMPSAPTAAPTNPNPSPQPSLLGEQPQGQLGPSPEQMQQQLMAETRDLTTRITSLARQHPESAEDYETAIQSLINGMTRSVISASSTEPTSPPNLVG